MTNSLPKKPLLRNEWRKKQPRSILCRVIKLKSGRKGRLWAQTRTKRTKAQPDARGQERARLLWFLSAVMTSDQWSKSALQKRLHSRFLGKDPHHLYRREGLAHHPMMKRSPRALLLLNASADSRKNFRKIWTLARKRL